MLPCEPAPKGAWASSFRVLSLQDWSKGFAKTVPLAYWIGTNTQYKILYHLS